MSKATVFSPATIGNIGPGFDVLGLAVEGFGDRFTLSLVDGPSKVLAISGRDASKVPQDPRANAAVIAAEFLLRKRGMTQGVELSSERQLPIAGGLGSSAAAAVGGALAAAAACHLKCQDHEILEAALAGEAFVAGRHLDNIAPCLMGGVTIVQSVDPIVIQRVPLASAWQVVLVSPATYLSTKEARGVLPASLPNSSWTRQMSLAIGLAVGLSSGNEEMVRESLHDPFAEAARSHLIPNFHAVKKAALAAGALGCSISGAGPTLFAILGKQGDSEKVSHAMVQAFAPLAAHAVVSKIASQGARLI